MCNYQFYSKKNIYALFQIGFAPVNGVVNLKLIDAGVPKDNIMIIQTAMFAIKAFLPVIVVKYTAGPKPISIYLNVIPIRCFLKFKNNQ